MQSLVKGKRSNKTFNSNGVPWLLAQNQRSHVACILDILLNIYTYIYIQYMCMLTPQNPQWGRRLQAAVATSLYPGFWTVLQRRVVLSKPMPCSFPVCATPTEHPASAQSSRKWLTDYIEGLGHSNLPHTLQQASHF